MEPNDMGKIEQSPEQTALFEKIRQLCLSFPETNERISHGAPSFFLKNKKGFVQYRWDHHGDGRIALWCAAAPGVQTMLVDSNPTLYFLPPYVAHLGWIGLRLDRDADWEEIASVIGDAYLCKAPNSTKVRK